MRIKEALSLARKNSGAVLLFVVVVIVPNLLWVMLEYGQRLPIPGGLRFAIAALLSPYYLPLVSIFGDKFFLTETVAVPLGISGMILSIIFYSVPFILWWIFMIRKERK